MKFTLWLLIAFVLLVLSVQTAAFAEPPAAPDPLILERSYSGPDGTLEIGGYTIGVEFHRSRPVPSRISFFEPVANSMDVSQDYWTRDTSRVFFFTLHDSMGGPALDTLGSRPFEYTWDPTNVRFRGTLNGFSATVEYAGEQGFASTTALDASITLINTTLTTFDGYLTLHLNTALRTCHTYTWRYPTEVQDGWPLGWPNPDVLELNYPFEDTDSARVLLMVEKFRTMPNGRPFPPVGVPGDIPDKQATTWTVVADQETGTEKFPPNAVVQGWLPVHMESDDTLILDYLLWSERMIPEGHKEPHTEQKFNSKESRYSPKFKNIVGLASEFIRRNAAAPPLANRWLLPDSYSLRLMNVDDSWLRTNMAWAKKVYYANTHSFENTQINMPCPAQYNFFFTHDVLVNDLGRVYSYLEFVKHDLNFIGERSEPETNRLVHARYFKNGEYVSEYCGADSWNHLWFILLTAKYLRHSGDEELVRQLMPIVDASVQAVLSQRGADGLMHGSRPDWWDIGNVPGPKTYLTVLTCRALRDYAATQLRLGVENKQTGELLTIADELQASLLKLWDEEAGYLLNINEGEWDRHYFSGSLTAVWFDLLDSRYASKLLTTAEHELLDTNLGIRNAMPPDFMGLEERYRFQKGEVGAAYKYFNGGVWPQGTAWYILALIHQVRLDEAHRALRDYLTVDGVAASPGGQPSFYEYRFADPNSPDYGRVDKPTFLWMGGWFEHCLYELMGVRESAWNIRLVPEHPAALGDSIAFPLTVAGKRAMVSIRGAGDAFAQIRLDGEPSYSAVLFDGAATIHAARGTPETPYVTDVEGLIYGVDYDEAASLLAVSCEGVRGHDVVVELVSPDRVRRAVCAEQYLLFSTRQTESGWWRSTVTIPAGDETTLLRVQF